MTYLRCIHKYDGCKGGNETFSMLLHCEEVSPCARPVSANCRLLVFYSLRGLPSRSQTWQTSFQAFFHFFFPLLFDTRRKIVNKAKYIFICLACFGFTCIARNLVSEELLRQVFI